MSLKCSCRFCSDNQYSVDLNSLSRKRPRGVSGILRVKNDAEFLMESIDSCIEVLDELIIVYNGCTDESPQIIREKAKQYGDKIKYYEYEPAIYAHNLSEDEYEFIKSQPADSSHLLANYYNFALSKVNYEFVMKIDADQIYLTDDLRHLCDAYRSTGKPFINPWNLLCLIYFYLGLLLYKKRNISILFNKKYLFRCYRKSLLQLVCIFKIPVFLSGYNMFYLEKSWYVFLGGKNENGIHILPPYNGVTDHTIFRLSSKTYFAPIESEDYARLNSSKRSLIEVLCGVRMALPYGFMWMHLNGMRRNLYPQQLENFVHSNDRFLELSDFIKKKFKEVNCISDTTILPEQSRLLYSILHDATDGEMIKEFAQKYSLMADNKSIYLKKQS